jgi:hypothetical protein
MDSSMTPARTSRWVCFIAIILTIAMVLWVAGPFGNHRQSSDMLASLLLLPVLAAWAVGPYAVANRFAQDAEGQAAWIFVAVQILAGVPVLGIYGYAFLIEVDTDPETGLAFAILPIYQFLAVLAAYIGVRLWQREW